MNKRQKGLIGAIILWMLLRVVYAPLVMGSNLSDMNELSKTIGVIIFGVILVFLVKDKKWR